MKFVRFLFRFFVALCIAVFLVCLGLWATGNAHLIKAVRSTYLVGKTGPTINDYTKFENRLVKTGSPKSWQKESNFNSFSIDEKLLKEVTNMKTVALLIVKDKKLVFEQYWDSYDEKSKTNSFSMAKSFTSLCIGAAIKEGKIKSVKQKVGDFIPEFSKGKKATISIEDLLTMSSGIDFGENYGDPFGFMAKAYYGADLYELTVEKELENTPGEVWKYQGGNTLLLSFIIKEATGKSLSDYFAEKFWQPMRATENALWSLNEEDGLEKSYCCFYSNARDFARVGQLMLDSGKWNGQQLIEPDYFTSSIKAVNIPNETGELIDYYGYQWWLGTYKDISFSYARGIQGQYIVSIPAWNMVLVRLGHKRDPTRGVIIPDDLFTYLEIAEQLN